MAKPAFKAKPTTLLSRSQGLYFSFGGDRESSPDHCSDREEYRADAVGKVAISGTAGQPEKSIPL